MTPQPPLFELHRHWPTVFWLSYSGWGLMEAWIFSRDLRGAKGQRRDRGSLPFLALLIFAGLFGAFLAVHSLPAARIGLPPVPLFWVAVALIWLGMALRIWAVVTLGRFFRITVFLQEDHVLIDHGPYRRLRNPSYTGGLVSMIGIGLGLGNWLSLALAVGGLLIGYLKRIDVEEKALREHFGEAYEAYARRRWALIPPIW